MSEATLCLSKFTRPASPSQTEGSARYRERMYECIRYNLLKQPACASKSSPKPDAGSALSRAPCIELHFFRFFAF